MKKTVIAGILLALIVLIMISVFSADRVLSEGDLYDEYLPVKYFQREQIYNLRLPLVSPGMGLGFPVYRDIQSGMYFPLNIIFMLPFDIYLLMSFAILMNLLFLGSGAYWLTFIHSGSRFKAGAFAVIAVLNGFTLSHLGHYSILCSLAAVPFYFIVRTDENSNILQRSLMLTLVLAGGHPQIFMYTAVTSLIYAFYRKQLKSEMRMILAFAGLSGVILLPLAVLSIHRISSMTAYNIMPLKSAVTVLFPDIHHMFSGIVPGAYKGPYISNESMFYQSMFLIFSIPGIIYALKEGLLRRSAFALLIIAALAGFTPMGGLLIFRTASRMTGFAFLIIAFFSVLYYRPPSLKHMLHMLVVIVLLGAILVIRGFSVNAVAAGAVLAALYTMVIIINRRIKSSIAKAVLLILICLDLAYSSAGIIHVTESSEMRNIRYDEIKGSTVMTFIPQEYMFYEDYIKDYFSRDDLEAILSYAASGNRGIYYGAYSFNIYNTMTYREYVSFFNDPAIMAASFGNISALKGSVAPEYIFMPDIPCIFSMRGDTFTVDMSDSEDTLKVFCSPDLITDCTECSDTEDYLSETEYKAVLLVPGQIHNISGQGTVYMIKKKGSIMHFPELMRMNGFHLISKGPFFLFRSDRDAEDIYMFHPDKAGFIDLQHYTFFPWDFAAGIALSISVLLALLINLKIKGNER